MRRQHLMLPLALIVATSWLASCAREEATEPTLPDVPAPSGDVAAQDLIPGQYIVVFKDYVGNPVRLANDLAAAHGLTLRHTYQHAIKGFSAKFPEAAEGVILQALQRNPNISYIEPNRYWYIDTHEVLRKRAVAAYAASMAAPPQFDPPSNLTANAVSTSRIDLMWQDNSKGESGFEIQRCQGAGCTSFAFRAEVGGDVTSFSDTGLDANTTYRYRVRAFKQKGNKPRENTGWSNIASATTTPPPVPAAPSDLQANPVSSSQIDLSWTDNSTNEDGFYIERCTNTGCADFARIDQVGANITSYNDTDVGPNTTYRYRVQAFNGGGTSAYSDIADATTPAPPQPPVAPSSLMATATGFSTIELAWTDNSDNENGFKIERCQGAGCSNFGQIDEVVANVTAYTDGNLAASSTYRYRVRAFNEGGDSGYSNEAEATTDDPPAGCNDNGVHDSLADPGLWGIVKVKANQNSHWKGVRGNDPGQCGMKAWFFGLDTGVDLDHPDLNVDADNSDCFVTGCNSAEDDHGHGSHTAGTAAAIDGLNGPSPDNVVGVAPGALIHAFKVCTGGGSCPLDAIIGGVDAVTARKNANPDQPMVANMSLGGSAATSIDQAVRHSVSAGVVFTLSAGNGVFGACFFPADAQTQSPARVGDDIINTNPPDYGGPGNVRVNGAITTTSSGQTDADVNCNYGNPVTVAAPGSGIKSTWLNGGYNTISGTSMAAPHSAGAAILVLQGDPGLTPTAVEQAIVNDLDPWTTNDLPNANGRLDARCLGTGVTSCAGSN